MWRMRYAPRKIARFESPGRTAMAAVEIHAHNNHSTDEFGRRVGVAIGIIGIMLAVVTIASHRAHTAAVISRSEANDQWDFYQAKKLREHLADVGAGLATALGTEPARVQPLVTKLAKDRDRYQHDAEQIQREAKTKEDESGHQEKRGYYLDVAEGFLELGLVLSSLYFLSKRRFFPILGGIAALTGMASGAVGFLL
jgi:hypothetical protein